MPKGQGYGVGAEEQAPDSEPGARDFASALDDLDDEVPTDGDGELDAEQRQLAEELGFTGEQAVAFKRFVETML